MIPRGNPSNLLQVWFLADRWDTAEGCSYYEAQRGPPQITIPFRFHETIEVK